MSKVIFEKIRFKNFLSYGNAETEFDYTSHRNTIVTAKNGSGKSGFGLDTLCYVLFNKPYRAIKLGQLINSINNKQLLVTIWFSIGVDRYKVVRGQKPSVFEIWKNDVLIPEDSNTFSYQECLESILGFNYKTFKQIVVIGTAGYVQFMQLDAKDRRTIIEEILSISVFSTMQDIAKKEATTIKSSITNVEYDIDLSKNQIANQQKIIKIAEEDVEKAESERVAQLEHHRAQLLEHQERLKELEEKLDALQDKTKDYTQLTTKKTKLLEAMSAHNHAINGSKKHLNFFSNNDVCPQCNQDISDELKQSVIESETAAIAGKETKLGEIETYLNALVSKLNTVESVLADIREIETQKRIAAINISNSVERVTSLSVPSKSFVGSVDEAKRQLKEILENVLKKTEEKSTLQTDLEYHQMAVNMLKDTGIKSRIIANFIPIMNQFINEYLNLFDMFVNFELDEMFNETIKSRNRDTFTYNSFSEGEKAKIDLSILFSWRKIAMMKNSISTNLIIFDETLDRSLDPESVDTFMDILDGIDPDVHTIVISHRNVAPEIFDRHVQIKKVNDMSILQTS